MLIQQFVCAFGAALIGGAFGLGASEPRAVGLGLPRRLLARVALLETLQITHFSHNHPSCHGVGESGRFRKIRVRRKAKTRTGRPGRHLQEVPSNCRMTASKNMFRSAKANIWCCITAAGKVGSQIVSVRRRYDLSLYRLYVNEFTTRTNPGNSELSRICHLVSVTQPVEFFRRYNPEPHGLFFQCYAVGMSRFGDFRGIIIANFRRE